MKTPWIYIILFILISILVSGCVHQKNQTYNERPVENNQVQEINNNLLTKRIEYTQDGILIEFKEFIYNKDELLIKEIICNKKGYVKETRYLEYTSGKLSRQLIKNKNNELIETREYMYEGNLLIEKNINNNDSLTQKHNYIYTNGLMEKESVLYFNNNHKIYDETYFLYTYDNGRLVRREKYRNNGFSELEETRNYIYNNSTLIHEEKINSKGLIEKFFLYKYGSVGITSLPLPVSRLYEEVFSDRIFHHFIVEITRDEWDGMTKDMLEYAKVHPITLLYQGDGRPYRTGKYRKADFIYKRPNGEEIIIQEIGIRTRGNESRRLPERNGQYQKTHFKIKFDEPFDIDKGTIEYKKRNNRRFAGMKALNFKWSRYFTYERYPNKTKINELFSYKLLKDIGLAVPEMSMACLTFRIDGKEVDYGIYGIVEHIDKEFLKKRFGNNDGDLYKCLYLGTGPHLTMESLSGNNIGVKDFDTNYRPIYDLKTNKKTSDHSDLKNFVNNLAIENGNDFITYIEENFEVDKFIKFLAMGMYINNLDDYRFLANNYYLYFPKKGKIEFIPYDFDISLGTGWHGEMNYKEFIEQDIFNTTSIPEMWGDYSDRPLVNKILDIKEYKDAYVAYLKEYIDPGNNLFLFSEYNAKFEQLSTLYEGEHRNDTIDKDPVGWHGFEAEYFFDKTKNILDQLTIPYKGYEVD